MTNPRKISPKKKSCQRELSQQVLNIPKLPTRADMVRTLNAGPDAVASEVRRLAQLGDQLAGSALACYLAVGELLADIKARLPHGDFTP